MAISFKVEGVPISANRDRAMFHTFAGNKSYVIKDIGDELEVISSASSFSISLGSGEAVICGGSMTVDGENTLVLEANESGFIVIRVDLSQTGANMCRLARVSSLVQENINNGVDMIYDFPLYEYTTNFNGVSSITDVREISNNALDSAGIVVVTVNNFNSLPQTISDDRIDKDHVVLNSVLTNPAVQTSEWTVLTQDGSLNISGSINGTTSLTLYLGKKI